MCIGLVDGSYVPASWGFNIVFLACHAAKLLSFGLGMRETSLDGQEYNVMIERIQRELEATIVLQRIRAKEHLRKSLMILNKEKMRKRYQRNQSHLIGTLASILEGPEKANEDSKKRALKRGGMALRL